VDGISHVVNFDLPNVPETYVHRIGRTARAGANGVAISLCDAEEAAFLRDIEKLIRMPIPAADHLSLRRPAALPTNQVRANGPSPHALGKRQEQRRYEPPRRSKTGSHKTSGHKAGNHKTSSHKASSHGNLQGASPRSRVAVAATATFVPVNARG
jgi:superfamily II DNA/RNA helicase